MAVTARRPRGAANPPAAWAGLGIVAVGLVLLVWAGVDPTVPDLAGVLGGVMAVSGGVTAAWHFVDARAGRRRRPAVTAAAAAAQPFCPYCGKATRSAARFCPTCGQRQ